MLRQKNFLCIVIALILVFSKQAEAKIINKDYERFKRFCRQGERIDLSHELELSDYVGSKLLEVTIRYNMLRSKLKIDWLVDGKTVSHASLKKGLVKRASYRFEQPITSSTRFGIRLTGRRGQIQLIEITAQIDDSSITEKEDKEDEVKIRDKKSDVVLGDYGSTSDEKSVPGTADWVTVATGWSIETPDEITNTAGIEIDGVMMDKGVIVAGPGIAIERIPGFDAYGRPDDQPGVSMELPFIFEYSGPAEQDLQKNHEQFKNGEPKGLRAMSVVVKNRQRKEEFRWDLFEFGLDKIELGSEGRKRYIYKHVRKPDNSVGIQRNPTEFPSDKSFNPATDKLVEMDGLLIAYAPVEVDEKNRTVTITLDYVEGSQMWLWVKETVEGRANRRVMSIADWSPEEGEKNRFIYSNCFPIRYRQFTGFGQSDKAKEKVVISYGWREER